MASRLTSHAFIAVILLLAALTLAGCQTSTSVSCAAYNLVLPITASAGDTEPTKEQVYKANVLHRRVCSG